MRFQLTIANAIPYMLSFKDCSTNAMLSIAPARNAFVIQKEKKKGGCSCSPTAMGIRIGCLPCVTCMCACRWPIM